MMDVWGLYCGYSTTTRDFSRYAFNIVVAVYILHLNKNVPFEI